MFDLFTSSISLSWLANGAARYLWLYLLCVLSLVFVVTFFLWDGSSGLVYAVSSEPQLLGTVMMFCLLPAYLIWAVQKLSSKTVTHLDSLQSLTDENLWQRARARCEQVRWIYLPLIIIGTIYGGYQNIGLLQSLVQDRGTVIFDLAFLFGNMIIWGTVALLLVWRLPIAAALYRLGHTVEIDIYNIDATKPLTRIATWDVLIVAGAMAFLPLQSLDAEFRLANYRDGVLVGVSSAVLLFFLPMYGVHRQIRRAKAARVAHLQEALCQIDRSDVVHLEAATAHLTRVRNISTWPLDINLITRVFAYGIIPPIAWIAAALVENIVDGMA